MQAILQLIVGGLATGAIYALLAAGLLLQWRMTQTVNFAQGEFAVLPAFFAALAANLGLPIWMAILVGLAVAVLIQGVLFKFLLVGLVSRHGVIPLTLATVAVALLLDQSMRAILGDERRPVITMTGPDTLSLGGISLPTEDLLILTVAGVVIAMLVAFLGDSRTGRAIQAVAHDQTASRVIGIRVGRMVLYAFVLNAALVAIASLLVGLPGQARLADGTLLTIAAITAVVLGGGGQLRGVISGALALGVAESLAATIVAPHYRAAVAPLVLCAALVAGRRWPAGQPAESVL